MHLWFHDSYLLLLIAATGVALITVVMALRMREAPGGIALTALMAGVAIWCMGCLIELYTKTVGDKFFGCQIQYLGITTVPPIWFLLISRYLHYDAWMTRARLLLFWLIPFLTLALIWTNPWHHLMYARMGLTHNNDLSYLRIEYGPWFLVHITFSWLMVVAGLAIILISLRNLASFYRRQTISLLFAALVPFLANVAYVLRIGPWPGLDFTPVAFAVSGLSLLLAIRHYRMMDISPVARHAVFESMLDGVIVLDMRRRILDTNPAVCNIFGFTMEELYGNDADVLFAAWLPEQAFIAEGGIYTVQLADRQGTVRWFDLRVSLLKNRQVWLLVLRDITDLHRLQERLNMLAYYDSLTGLPNRLLANDRMIQELARVKRKQTRMAVMFLDADGFKGINDTLGHAAGDHLLHEIAQRLLSCVRESDTVARVGGDEFIVVLSDFTNPAVAEITATRILSAFALPFQIDDHEAHITVSIGIAIAPDDSMDIETLLRQSDDAMYQAKKSGKNAVVLYSELPETAATTAV